MQKHAIYITFSCKSARFTIPLIDLKCNIMSRQKTEITIEGNLRVKELLEERGLLMKDFADEIGITRETLTRTLKGNPQYSTLKTIADGLGVSVAELFTDFLEVDKVKNEVHGCIYIGKEAHLVNSKKDIEDILSKI